MGETHRLTQDLNLLRTTLPRAAANRTRCTRTIQRTLGPSRCDHSVCLSRSCDQTSLRRDVAARAPVKTPQGIRISGRDHAPRKILLLRPATALSQ
jgi:hypothetical protein